MKHPARVAIVGRPNVGKSTLFNRIVGGRRALVHPTPGVTRDVQRADTEWNDVPFEIIDTGGLYSGSEDELSHEVEARALKEASHSDAMIFVVDGQAGLVPADADVADRVRQTRVPVLLAVNKVERKADHHAGADFFKLGFDSIYPISALHGEGVGDLLDDVTALLPRRPVIREDHDLKLALVGRQNVGKSSLVNALVGEDINIVNEIPGTTRDSVDLSIRWHGRRVTLVDTAGIKRKARTKDGLTALTALKSIDSIERADVVAIVLDASRDIANQDIKVASYAHKAGKGIIFVVNKWDLLDKDNSTAAGFEKLVRRAFRFVSYAPILFTSALTGQRVSRIVDLAWKVKESAARRIATSDVNRLIEATIAHTPPPAHGGGNGKIYYATQVDVSPPTFNFFVNKRAFFGRSYLRFLNNRLRDAYGFEGTLIRIKLVEKPRKER